MTLISILEIIGVIAASISGALVSVKANLDVFGVVFIGTITAVGGGLIRDLLIGATPPAIFSNLYLLFIAMTSALIVFTVAYVASKKFEVIRQKISIINNVFDAIGLASFTVIGSNVAFSNGLSHNPFLTVTLGMITGVGGGIFRDILTATTPYIFKKHVYALASIGGGILYYILRMYTDYPLLAALISIAFIFLIRMLATKYRWELPKVQLADDDKQLLPFQKDVEPTAQQLEIAITETDKK